MPEQVNIGEWIRDDAFNSYAVRILTDRKAVQTSNYNEISLNDIPATAVDYILERLERVESGTPRSELATVLGDYEVYFYPPVQKPAYVTVGCFSMTAGQVRELARQLKELEVQKQATPTPAPAPTEAPPASQPQQI